MTIAAIILGIVVTGYLGLLTMGLTAPRPDNLGVRDGQLADLAETPNCVSSQTTDESRRMAPIPFSGSADDALDTIRRIVSEMPGSRIVSHQGHYLYAVFRSRLFRFPDDVEFLIPQDAHEIHFRSASRVGHSDLGVNRKRLEQIRERFQQ